MTLIEKNKINRRIAILSLIVALGVVLHRLEILIPLPAPWIKLGLANVMTLVTLIFFGLREAVTVTVKDNAGLYYWWNISKPDIFFESVWRNNIGLCNVLGILPW